LSLVVHCLLAFLDILVDGLERGLDVSAEHLFLLLALTVFIGLVDLVQVLLFLSEESLRFLHGVVKVNVLAVFLGFQVHVVEQLHETLVELGDFDLAWAVLDFALHDVDVPVFDGDELSLLKELVVLLVELLVNLLQHSRLLCLLQVHFLLLHSLKLGVKALFLFLALLFQLLLVLSQSSFLFDKSLYSYDLVLLDV